MLTPEQKVIVEGLAGTCNVPKLFIELVIETEASASNKTMDERRKHILFLENVLTSEWASTLSSQQLEFESQSIASDMDIPIQLARMAVDSLSKENIDETEKIPVLKERINFLLKVFSIIKNNPHFSKNLS